MLHVLPLQAAAGRARWSSPSRRAPAKKPWAGGFEVADHIAVGLDNARLFERSRAPARCSSACSAVSCPTSERQLSRRLPPRTSDERGGWRLVRLVLPAERKACLLVGTWSARPGCSRGDGTLRGRRGARAAREPARAPDRLDSFVRPAGRNATTLAYLSSTRPNARCVTPAPAIHRRS
jgi:hypothetical protein